MSLSRENPLVAFYLERGTIKFFRSKTLTHYSECPIVDRVIAVFLKKSNSRLI